MSDKAGNKIHRVDWVRVQRNYGTGRFTDVELAAKHNTAREVISRRRRADRASDPASWPVDLRADVKRATAALLMRDQVSLRRIGDIVMAPVKTPEESHAAAA